MEKLKSDKLTIIGIIVPIIMFSLNIISVAYASLIIIMQIAIVYLKIRKNRFKINSKIQNICIYIIFALFITYIIDLLGGYAKNTIITTTLTFINILLIFLIVSYTDNKKETFEDVLKIFIVFVIFLCIYGIIIRIFGEKPQYYNLDENGNRIYRQELVIGNFSFYQRTMGDSAGNFSITSLTNNSNVFSYLILYAFIFNYMLLKEYKTEGKKYKIRYIFFIIFLISMYFAGSRMAIFLLVLSFLLINYLMSKNVKKYTEIYIIIGTVLIMGIARYLLVNSEVDFSVNLNGRDKIWSVMPEVLRENIVLGKGLDASRNIMQEKIGMDVTMFSCYYTMIANYGLILTILFFLILFSVIYKNIVKYLKDRNYIHLLTSIIILVSLIQGLVENNILRFAVWNNIYVFIISYNFACNLERKNK